MPSGKHSSISTFLALLTLAAAPGPGVAAEWALRLVEYVADVPATAVECGGGRLYVASETPTVHVYDLSLGEFGAPTATWTFPDPVWRLKLDNGFVYAGGERNLLMVADASSGTVPPLAGVYQHRLSFASVGVTVRDGLAYIAARDSGMVIVDVADPTDLTLVGEWVPPARGSDVVAVEVRGQYAYLMARMQGMYIVDISDPSDPVGRVQYSRGELGHFSLESVSFHGHHAFVSDVFSGTIVLDISDPLNPTEVGMIPHWAGWNSVVDSGRLFVTSDRSGVYVFDLEDPSNPRPIADYPIDAYLYDIAVAGDYVFVAADALGPPTLYVLELIESPAATRVRPLLHQNYPNPFNPSTTIAFETVEPGRVTLSVHDVRGRLVRTLQDGWLDPDAHRVEWDGTNARGRRVGGGVYFCRLETATGVSSRKLVVVK